MGSGVGTTQRTTQTTAQTTGTAVQPVQIGVQLDGGKMQNVTLTPGKPYEINGVTVTLDPNGHVNVTGTNDPDHYSVVNGSEVGVPGSVVLGVEVPGKKGVYFAIPENQVSGVDVHGGGANDDYWAPFNDKYHFVSIDDKKGNNWVTNIGAGVTGQISVADNERQGLQNEAGDVTLLPSGQNSNPIGDGIKSFWDSVVSWIQGLI